MGLRLGFLAMVLQGLGWAFILAGILEPNFPKSRLEKGGIDGDVGPGEELTGLEGANAQLGGSGGGTGNPPSNGTQGLVQTKRNRALNGKFSADHGHKCGDAIREEGSCPSMNGGEQGLVPGVNKNKSCLERLRPLRAS